ncbi:F-box protein At1g22220-like [Olea europaea var. sylvestris]|uniref:F-box At1g78100 n=1 Tax=Olea europaea subsp. europaea TaxID=158383 RepID=A0A8S0SNG6_OLEEU|nr:F-box protein At1g22220-like [Olea europaea var. sylvestris]CAA2994487.1 F-box At1g78100 [Olea europaea subsp. europaea]
MAYLPDESEFDCFESLPDPIVLLIFNNIADIKFLIRCRSVSKRFNSLVPQTDSVLLRVDRVISATDSEFDDGVSFVFTLFKSLYKSLQDLISPHRTSLPDPTRSQNSPTQILRGFNGIKNLRIELPSGDLRLEKGTTIKWVTRFGKTLKSCVILGFRNSVTGSEGMLDFNDNDGAGAGLGAGGGLKMRVVWTISALIAASARHYMMLDVISEQNHLTNLIVNDRENEGTVIVDKDGLQECRNLSVEEEINESSNLTEGGLWWRTNRTTVPAVTMRMRHEARMELSGGMIMEGATLVVVRPVSGGGERGEVEEKSGDIELATEAFGKEGIYAEAAERLLKSRTYILEMNSF